MKKQIYLTTLISVLILFNSCEEDAPQASALPPPPSSACISIKVDGVSKNINPSQFEDPCGRNSLFLTNGNITSFVFSLSSICSNSYIDYVLGFNFTDANVLPNGFQVGTQYSSLLDITNLDPWSVVNYQDLNCSSTATTYVASPQQNNPLPQTFQITNIDYANGLISGEITALMLNALNTSNTSTIECIFTNVPFQKIGN